MNSGPHGQEKSTVSAKQQPEHNENYVPSAFSSMFHKNSLLDPGVNLWVKTKLGALLSHRIPTIKLSGTDKS